MRERERGGIAMINYCIFICIYAKIGPNYLFIVVGVANIYVNATLSTQNTIF